MRTEVWNLQLASINNKTYKSTLILARELHAMPFSYRGKDISEGSLSLGLPSASFASSDSSRQPLSRSNESGRMQRSSVRISSGTRFYVDVIAKMHKEDRLNHKQRKGTGKSTIPTPVGNPKDLSMGNQRAGSTSSSNTSASNHSASDLQRPQ